MMIFSYTEVRNPDAKAITDLAMYNYVEMRSAVLSFSYKFRKMVESTLHRFFPSRVIPLYSMVSFSQIPYSVVMKRWRRQTFYFNVFGVGIGLGSLGAISAITIKLLQNCRK
jgi:kynurenine 3-monooxygenase